MPPTTTRPLLALLLSLVLGLTACAEDRPEDRADVAEAGSGAEYPDVRDVEIRADDGTYSLDVTISSPYDSPDRYADGWRVLDEDGEVLGEMELAHDHAAEQPFTRTQTGLEIPEDVRTVTVEGRDSTNGYGGTTVEVAVPRR